MSSVKKADSAYPPAVVSYMSYCGLGIVRSLGRRAIPVYALDPDPRQVGMDSRFCRSRVCPSIESDEERHIEFLIGLSKSLGQKPVLFPTGDNTVLSYGKYENILKDYFLFTCPRESTIQKLVTKDAFFRTALECDIPIPDTYAPSSLSEVNDIASKISYPCIIKPVMSASWRQESIQKMLGGGGKKVIVVHKGAELLNSYKKIAPYDPNVVISEVIPGDDKELFYFVFYMSNDHKILGCFSGRKLRLIPVHFGSASFVESVYVEDLNKLSINFLTKLRYKGLGGIEFKRDPRDGRFKLIEFNARFGLWDMLGARCGVDIAYIAYSDTIGRKVNQRPEYRTGIKWASIYRDTRAFLSYKKEDLITFRNWLSSLRGEIQWAVFAWDDIRPALSLTLGFILRKIGQIFKRIAAGIFLITFMFFPVELLHGAKKDGWFPFYIPWTYCEGSRIDFSFLLDAPAGKHGFIAVNDGHFSFEDGTRARFWGVNIHSDKACFPTYEQAEDIAKRLAQLGCNIVRMHLLDYKAPHGIVDSEYNDAQHLSDSQMDKMDYFIFQLKKNGIYVTFDVLGLGARRFRQGDGVVDYDKIKSGAGGISFFNERIIELSKKFALDFLSHVNPYTGTKYLDEPAIAMIEMTNENTLFGYWIREQFTPYYEKEIDGLWKAWLKDKKRGPEQIYKNWYDDREFKFELQDGYQRKMYEYLRSIGVRCPIGASNTPHDNLNLMADSSMDFTDIHPYWDHPYKKIRMHNRALIKQSHLNLGTIINQASRATVYNRPLVFTEWDSIWPNDWRALDILTTASYAALNEVDALFLYSYNGGWGLSWDSLEEKIYYPTVVFNDPAKMGVFSLGALIVLREDVQPARNTYYVSYDKDTLFDMVEPLSDRTKLAGIMYRSKLKKKFNEPTLDYSCIAEFEKDKDRVVSDTGEIVKDSKKGIFVLRTPRMYSFSGFIGGEKTEGFSGIRFYTESEFTTFTVTSLEEKDISESDHLLVTVIGKVRNRDQRLTPHITKGDNDLQRDVYVLDKGKSPILVESINGKVFIKKRKKKNLIKVFVLDEKGLRRSEIPIREDMNGFSFNVSGEYGSIYYEILRR